MIRALALIGALSLLLFPVQSQAHPGGLNAQGCHTNHRTGDYHCHRAPAARTATGPAVKMSKNGICHPRGGTYYDRTFNYTSYGSMRACIAAGGRAPRA